MDPYVTTSGASKGMLWTVYDRLVARDLDLVIQPALATGWKNLDDLTWELRLRQGVTFHNGEPFNGDAVKFSFARYVDPSIKNGYSTLLKPVTEVQVVDPYTVRIKTSEPFAELIETLGRYVEMLPRRPRPTRLPSPRSRLAPARTSSCRGRPTTSSSSKRPVRTSAASRR